MSAVPEQASPELITVEIDGRECKAPRGSMIIHVADEAGIKIPRFCYHRKLPIAANCRMCLVDVEKAPKPLPACATPVMDGMKIFTRSRRALDAQRAVMEFLLINHPLDCPICDQGGECELQDLSLGYGRGVSRFVERKRVVKDEDLGSLIATDMTRCICCTRCVRFLNEIAGTCEMGGIGRGEKTQIGTYIGRSIDSELSGNIIDVCPVGALTNKVFRFQARAWELMAHESIAAHDCVGSNTYVHTRAGKVLRVVPRDNEAVNECWLSDRDRYSHQGLYAPDRLTVPHIKVDGKWLETDWETALQRAADDLVSGEKNGASLGALISPNASLEELFLVQKLVRALGSDNVDHRLRQLDFSDQDNMPLDPRLGVRMEGMSQLQSVLLLGSNIHQDQPILGHKLRRAFKGGASLFAINPMAYTMHFDLKENLCGDPWEMQRALAATAAAMADLSGKAPPAALAKELKRGQVTDSHRNIAESILNRDSAAIIVGNSAQEQPNAARLVALARYVAEAGQAGLCLMPQAANSVGAWQAGAVPHRGIAGRKRENIGLNARQMGEQTCARYLLYQVEPSADHALGKQARDCIAAAQSVVFAGSYAGEEIMALADVLLPIGQVPEISGTLVNADGVPQHSQAAVHPSGEARPGWKVLRVLGNLLHLNGFEYVSVADVFAEISTAMDNATRIPADQAPAAESVARPKGLLRISPVGLYDGDALLRRACALQETVHASGLHIAMNRVECRRQNVTPGDVVTVSQDAYSAELEVTLDSRLPDGVACIAGGSAAARALGAATGSISIGK